MALLNLQNITLAFGSAPLLDDVSLQLHQGEKIALLGRNGAGKSTLMKIIEGTLEPDRGPVIREKGLKTALLPQEVPRNLTGTVRAVVAGGIPALASPEWVHDAHEEELAHQRVDRALSHINIDPDLVFETLSAGMKRRVVLGRTIADEPDILLLDEPTNHLDLDTIRWLEEFLVRWDRTIFFVTHDRAFLQKVANRIVEIDRGRLFDWQCDYQTFLARKEAWLEAEEAGNRLFDKKLAQEEIWIRKGIKARRTRNEGRVRALVQMRAERAARRERPDTVRMDLRSAEQSGKMVIEAGGLCFDYGAAALVRDFSIRIVRGDRIGIMGPNGCGKSTLVKLLLGELQPTAGTVRLGARLECAYFDQMRNRLDESRTVRENVNDGADIIDPGGRNRHVIGYLQDFLFTPDRADVPVSLLSGGEKNRLMLAKLFTRPSNLLVMDEPTNDLDIETIELLEELLLDYPGTLLLVSHDRSFINNVATSTLVFEGQGRIGEYAGGYDDWQLQSRAPAGDAARERTIREKRPAAKTKLTFKERKELEEIPARVDTMEARVREIYATLADPAFYQEGGPRVAALNAELATLEAELEVLMHRWDELESFEA